jgi:hypothetical protein
MGAAGATTTARGATTTAAFRRQKPPGPRCHPTPHPLATYSTFGVPDELVAVDAGKACELTTDASSIAETVNILRITGAPPN